MEWLKKPDMGVVFVLLLGIVLLCGIGAANVLSESPKQLAERDFRSYVREFCRSQPAAEIAELRCSGEDPDVDGYVQCAATIRVGGKSTVVAGDCAVDWTFAGCRAPQSPPASR
jgi:hypothetical protein